MTHHEEFSELQELKKSSALMQEKLNEQDIISDQLLDETMKKSLSGIKKLYRDNFYLNVVAAAILTVVFIAMGKIHWGFILLMDIVALLSCLLDARGYRILNPDKLFSLSMSEAAERVIRHKRWRKLSNWTMLPFAIALATWTVLIACDYTWKPFVFFLCIAIINTSVIIGLITEKKKLRQLDEALEQLRSMR